MDSTPEPRPFGANAHLETVIKDSNAAREARRREHERETRKLQLVAVGALVVLVGGIIAAVLWFNNANTEDDDAAAELNRHINSVGGDFPAWEHYLGAEPTGGKGAVAVRTSLGEDAGSKQSAGAMCSALLGDRESVPSVKSLTVRSSTGYGIWSCW